MPCHAMPCHAMQYHTIPYHTIPYHTIPYHTIPYPPYPTCTLPCSTLSTFVMLCHTSTTLYHVIITYKYILTCRRAIKRKKTFEYLLNCSNKNFGKNVMTLYLAVLKCKQREFHINLKGQYLDHYRAGSPQQHMQITVSSNCVQ